MGSVSRGVCFGGGGVLEQTTPLPNQKSGQYASYWYTFLLFLSTVADPRGECAVANPREGALPARAPYGPKFSQFHAFFLENLAK